MWATFPMQQVSDLSDSILTAMRQKVADEAGVPLVSVAATVTAGSAVVEFTVSFASEAAADAAVASIGEQLAPPHVGKCRLGMAIEATAPPGTAGAALASTQEAAAAQPMEPGGA